MALHLKKEKINKAFFLLSIIIIIVLALLLLRKNFAVYFKKVPFSLKLVRIIGAKYGLKGPAGVAFGRRNDIYVVDSGNSRIIKFNIKGKYLGQWGIEGKAAGEFMVPLFAAAHGNPERIYAVDSGNSRIQVFNRKGNFISEFGISKNPRRTLIQPTFIGFSDNKIYVANSSADDLMIYSKNGIFYERKGNSVIRNNAGAGAGAAAGGKTTGGGAAGGGQGNNNGNNGKHSPKRKKTSNSRVLSSVKFKKPVSIAFSKKYIYISDYSLSKILVFNRQFDYIGSIGTPGEEGYQLYHPVGIVYKNGRLYVANYGRSILTVFKLDNGYNVVKSYNFGIPGLGGKDFNHESNISVSLNGRYIAVADTDNDRVALYRIQGAK